MKPKMRSYRKSGSHYDRKNPPIIFVPQNEFDIFIKEHPELAADAEKYNWNIGQRYLEQQPKTKEEFEKLFAASTEYVKRSALTRHWKMGLHRELLLHYLLPEDAGYILDFGCGAGNDGLFYANMGFKVTFADVDGINLQFVKWRLARRGIDFCEVISSDTRFPRKHYDLILCIDVLEHIFDAHEYFSRMYNSLKVGGLFYLSFNSSSTELDCYSWKDFYKHIQPCLDELFEQVDDGLYRKLP